MAYRKLPPEAYTKVPFSWRVKFGNFGKRFYSTNKFGYNAQVGTSYEDIWSAGGTLGFLSAADTLDVVSSSTADDVGSTGATQIRIVGLDGNYNLISEDVAMDGQTTVTTTSSFLRVFRAFTIATGTGNVNAGTITITDNGGSTTQATIPADSGQSQMAIYTIRDGYYGLVTSLDFAVGGADSALVELQTRAPGEGWRVREIENLGTGVGFSKTFDNVKSPILIDPKSDIKIRAKKTGAGGSTSVSASFSVWEIKQEEINA